MRGNNQKGLSLLEIVVVIVIIGILSGIAFPKFVRFIEGSRAQEAIAAIGVIRGALERCYLASDESYMTCAFDDFVRQNTLDISSPGFSPGKHFIYDVSTNDTSYEINAVRTTADGGDYGLFIAMGYGCQPVVRADGKGVSFIWRNDGKMYWDAADIYKSAIPK
jgi:prepilin-type N-terminal cleavage/methylation domain-containing protein